jgi:hypothetical protein
MSLQKKIPSGILKLALPQNISNLGKTRFFCIPSRFATQLNFRREKLVQTTNYFSKVPDSRVFVFCPEDEYIGYKGILGESNKNISILSYRADFKKPKDYNIGDARNIILRFGEYLHDNYDVSTMCVVDDDITKLQHYPSKTDVNIEDTAFWEGIDDEIIKNNYMLYSFVNSSSVRALKLPEGKLGDSFFEADRLFPSGMIFLNLGMWTKNKVFYPPTRYLEDIVFSYRCSQYGRVMVTRRVIKTHGNSTASKSTTRNKDNKDLSTYTDYDRELHMKMVNDAIKQGVIQFGTSTFYAKFYHDLAENRWINMKGLGYTYFTTIMRAFIEDKNINKYPNILKKKLFFQTV